MNYIDFKVIISYFQTVYNLHFADPVISKNKASSFHPYMVL